MRAITMDDTDSKERLCVTYKHVQSDWSTDKTSVNYLKPVVITDNLTKCYHLNGISVSL